MKRRILNLLIAIDQLAWVALTLGNGLPDETISAALWRMNPRASGPESCSGPWWMLCFSLIKTTA